MKLCWWQSTAHITQVLFYTNHLNLNWEKQEAYLRPYQILMMLSFHCGKSVRIQTFSGFYFPAYRVFLRIQSKCGKIGTRNSLGLFTSSKGMWKGLNFNTQIKYWKNWIFWQKYLQSWQPIKQETTWNHRKSPKTIWNHPELSATTRNHP